MDDSHTRLEAPPPYSEAIADTSDCSPEDVTFRLSTFSRDSAFSSNAFTFQRASTVLQQPTPGQRLTFYDFLPFGCDILTPAQETFSSLVARVNNFLRSSSVWRVKKCETISATFDVQSKTYITEVYYDDEKKERISVLGIRLWLTTPEQDFGVSLVQPELGVVHMVARSAPIVNRAGKTVLAFENIQQLLDRFKQIWEHEPLPGRFLSLDTRKTPVHNIQSFNPEVIVIQRDKHYAASTLEVIRVFYEVGTPDIENIEIVDFLPITTIPMLGSVQRESFDELFNTTSTWLKKHCWDPGHRLLNIQTLELEVRPGGRSDTARLWSTAEAKKEFYVRFLRASYVTGSSKVSKELSPNVELSPSPRTFVPVQVPGSTRNKLKLESVQKSRERLEAWVKATGAVVLSAETVWLRSSSCENLKKTCESNATVNSGSRFRWVSAVRLYLDKEYTDPPAAMLPAMPKTEGLCSIS